MLGLLIGLACIAVICIGCQKSKGFRDFILVLLVLLALAVVIFIIILVTGG